MKKSKQEKLQAKEERSQVLTRLMYFAFAVGTLASVIILTMLVSDSSVKNAIYVVAGLDALTAIYFVARLILNK